MPFGMGAPGEENGAETKPSDSSVRAIPRTWPTERGEISAFLAYRDYQSSGARTAL